MVDEVTTWFLGSWGGYSTFREFEESTFRRFEVRGPVGLWTFQIRGVTLFGWGDLKKTALFSVKGGEKRALDVFSLDSVGRRGRRSYSCSVKFWVKRSTSVLKSG